MKSFLSVLCGIFVLSASGNAEAATVAIPCLDASGAVKNAAPADVCKAMLPKCSEMKDKLTSELKNMLEWKIYGYYYLNKDIKLDKLSGMQNGSVPEGEDLPYPICSVVGHKVSGNEPGEIDSQSIPNGKSCGDHPIFKNGSAWNYKTKIQYEGEKGKKWFSYVMGAYPWELRRNAYEVLKQLNGDLSNINEVIHTDAMTNDVKHTLDMLKAATSKLSAEAKSACNLPHDTDVVKSCQSGTLDVTDPVQKLCTLAKSQVALNEVALPNMLVYEVMDRTKKMHADLFGSIFSADSNPRFKELVQHCAKNQSVVDKVGSVLSPIGNTLKNAITANKSYSCNTSCMTDGEEWYTNTTDGDGVSSKNAGGSKQRKCAKKSKYNLLTGHPESSVSSKFETEGWIQWVWNIGGWFDGNHKGTSEEDLMVNLNIPNPTNSVGFAALVESIIRREICPQAGNSKTGANPCDDVAIKDKPAGK